MWVYPGATHRRFEHSLGVMELAGRVYDVITQDEKLTDSVREQLPEISDFQARLYWRQVVRLAGLCHDVGHLPFSHAAEKELLSGGLDHEGVGERIILSMEPEFQRLNPPVRARDVARIALGPGKLKTDSGEFTPWEMLLAEIITSDAFGADRMDYLLRDSHHTGVAYGRFDLLRLVDTLRILQTPESRSGPLSAFTLGIEEGGLQVAEGLALARYYMYSQVYLHPVRRIYDLHLQEFLVAWLPGGKVPVDPLEDYLKHTDSGVIEGLRDVSANPNHPGYDSSNRILNRKHFRLVYSRNPEDMKRDLEPAKRICSALCHKYGAHRVRRSRYRPKDDPTNFPVLLRDGTLETAMSVSDVFSQLPFATVDFVYVAREIIEEAKNWLKLNKKAILSA